jgi:deoxyribodipyrimidine photo-lyase
MNILWFRRDLRLADNESLSRACSNNAKVLPCLVVDPWLFEWREISPARLKFWFDSVQNLDRQLTAKGSRLILLEGRSRSVGFAESAEVIRTLGNKLKAEGHSPQLFFNRDMQEESDRQRDAQVIQFCQEAKIPCQIGLSNFLQTVHRWDDWYKEYYDYVHQPVHKVPESINTPEITDLPEITIEELADKHSHYWSAAKVYFPGGESAAAEVLQSFLVDQFPGYHWKISRPWLTQQGATSHLSPHFAWGTISIRTVYQQAEARANQFAPDSKQAFSLKAFRLRLRWQCSFSQRFYLTPEIAYQNRFPEFDEWYQGQGSKEGNRRLAIVVR